MVFSFKPHDERNGNIPRKGEFPDEFYKKLDEYLSRLELCKGRYIIRPLNKLIDRLAQDMCTLADLADDDILWDVAGKTNKMLGKDANQMSEAGRRGPKNMLDSLPDTFSEQQLEALRTEMGKTKEGTKGQLSKWVFRKFIIFCSESGLYSKTDEYLNGSGFFDLKVQSDQGRAKG